MSEQAERVAELQTWISGRLRHLQQMAALLVAACPNEPELSSCEREIRTLLVVSSILNGTPADIARAYLNLEGRPT